MYQIPFQRPNFLPTGQVTPMDPSAFLTPQEKTAMAGPQSPQGQLMAQAGHGPTGNTKPTSQVMDTLTPNGGQQTPKGGLIDKILGSVGGSGQSIVGGGTGAPQDQNGIMAMIMKA